jgi:DNA-directed RNA polymerase subunit M/transcription elongation factor TFIIS
MEPTSTGRSCPKCGSSDYLFRGRKKLAEEPGKPAGVETKYRCRACGHEWKVRIPSE